MNDLSDIYEATAIPVTHPMIVKAWNVTGGQQDYRVELTVRGEWTCTCPSYVHQGRKERPASCKHTRFVAEQQTETV